MKRIVKDGDITVENDGAMLHICGEYYVRESKADQRFYVCDVDGIKPGEDLEHIGEDFPTLAEAIAECDKQGA